MCVRLNPTRMADTMICSLCSGHMCGPQQNHLTLHTFLIRQLSKICIPGALADTGRLANCHLQKAFAAERIQALMDVRRCQEVDTVACHALMMRKQEDLMQRLHRAEEALQHSTRDCILSRQLLESSACARPACTSNAVVSFCTPVILVNCHCQAG